MADAAPSHSASRVNESAIVGKSHARTQCRKPAVGLCKVLHHAKGRDKSRLAGILASPCNVPLKSPDEAADLVIVPSLDPTHQTVRVEGAGGTAVGDAAGNEGARRKRRGRVIKRGGGIGETEVASRIEPCPAHNVGIGMIGN